MCSQHGDLFQHRNCHVVAIRHKSHRRITGKALVEVAVIQDVQKLDGYITYRGVEAN